MSTLRSEFENGGIDSTAWHELLGLFNEVGSFMFRAGYWANFSRALKVDRVVGSSISPRSRVY